LKSPIQQKGFPAGVESGRATGQNPQMDSVNSRRHTGRSCNWFDTYMKKIGSCRHCGSCCGTRKLWKALNWREKLATILMSRGKIITGLAKNTKCRHLYRNGMNQYKCSIYAERSDFCRKYPENPDDLLPGCGYKFVE